MVFQPTVIVEWEDHHDLRAIGFLQTPAQRVDDQSARQILILDIEELTRGRDEIEVQFFNFAAGYQRIRARDRDGHIGHIRRHVFGPRIARLGFSFRDGRTCGSMPALANDFGESRRRIAIHHRLHVMGRGIPAARILRAMLRRIPAAARDVHASSEGELSVDDDDFLVMASTRRMDIVLLEMNARVFERVLSEHKLRIANVGEQYREVPRKNENVQVRISATKVVQKLPERTRALGWDRFRRAASGYPDPMRAARSIAALA